MSIAYISHAACSLHETGVAHPETPDRLHAIHDLIIERGLEFALSKHDAPRATAEQLQRVHDPEYVDRITSLVPESGLYWLDKDTPIGPHSLDAALHAAGAVVYAVDLVMGDSRHSAFCAVRPPGHHAGRNSAMGFCFFNNIAIGAAHAIAEHGLQRIAIVDFDVHHGNGTEEIFSNEERVLFCSSYQHPFYPFTESDTQGVRMLKIPLDAGTGSQTFRGRIESEWLDELDAYQPELVLVSAGFDGHWQDEVADLNLTEQDYSWITGKLRTLADRHAGGRIVSVLEGGYALPALARSVVAHLRALLD